MQSWHFVSPAQHGTRTTRHQTANGLFPAECLCFSRVVCCTREVFSQKHCDPVSDCHTQSPCFSKHDQARNRPSTKMVRLGNGNANVFFIGNLCIVLVKRSSHSLATWLFCPSTEAKERTAGAAGRSKLWPSMMTKILTDLPMHVLRVHIRLHVASSCVCLAAPRNKHAEVPRKQTNDSVTQRTNYAAFGRDSRAGSNQFTQRGRRHIGIFRA